MNDDLIFFAKNLKKFRKKRKLTLEKLAELVEISPNHIFKLEAARTNPSFQLVSRLSAALNVEMKDLFNFDNYKKNDEIRKEFLKALKTVDIKHLQILYNIHKYLGN